MKIENSVVILGLVIVTLLAVSTALAARKNNGLKDGTWGGQHIHIEITNGAAQIEYDCAHGEISGPLTIDRRGNFSWHGYYTREAPGPIRLGKNPPRLAATYSGTITDDAMSLTVTLADGQQLDSFTLKRGATGRITKCR
ncbi:MAG TPA: hypothetical protein VJT50_13585 [Pyrinomonadaceae bacterium]|nr:hypothetical protein [Pyrinomonadaceae bacterium]